MKLLSLLLFLLLTACASSPALPEVLPEPAQKAVYHELMTRVLGQPQTLEVRDGIIVADYEQISTVVQQYGGARKYGETRLIVIREALLPFGYKDYRVNVNGPPPGTGLIQRYGSARYLDAIGKVEWITPE